MGSVLAGVLVAGPLLIGLALGIWLKRWRVVVVLFLAGLAVSLVGAQADWFGDTPDGDFTADGGAIVFWLFYCAPVAVGAALGIYLTWSRARQHTVSSSTLPVVPPPSASGSGRRSRRHP